MYRWSVFCASLPPPSFYHSACLSHSLLDWPWAYAFNCLVCSPSTHTSPSLSPSLFVCRCLVQAQQHNQLVYPSLSSSCCLSGLSNQAQHCFHFHLHFHFLAHFSHSLNSPLPSLSCCFILSFGWATTKYINDPARVTQTCKSYSLEYSHTLECLCLLFVFAISAVLSVRTVRSSVATQMLPCSKYNFNEADPIRVTTDGFGLISTLFHTPLPLPLPSKMLCGLPFDAVLFRLEVNFLLHSE